MNNYTVRFFYSANNRNGYDVQTFTGTQRAAEHAAARVLHDQMYAGVTVHDANNAVVFEQWGHWDW